MSDIKLFLKSLTGKTTTVTVPANSRIGFVKQALQDKDGIPPQQQSYTFGTTELTDDDMTLERAGIKNESTIQWKLRLSSSPAPQAKVALAGPYPHKKPNGPTPSRPLISNADALSAVVECYSVNDTLTYRELVTFCAGFYVVSLPNRPQRNNIIVKALSNDAVQHQHNMEGSVKKADLVKFLMEEAKTSADDKEKLRLGLLRHGYLLSNNIDMCYARETPHPGQVIDFEWLWLHEFEGKTNVKMCEFTMEVGNSMHRFHLCPSDKVLALLDASQQSNWKANVKRWAEEEDAERLAKTLFSGKTTLSEKGREVVREIFKRFDADNDGLLNMVEAATTCFFIRDAFLVDWERAVPISPEKFETFFIREGYDQMELKKFLRSLGADERCDTASFKWPSNLTLSAYLLAKLNGNPQHALHTMKSLVEKLQLPNDVVDKLLQLAPTNKAADEFLLSLAYRNGTQPEIADAVQALKVLSMAFSFLDWGGLLVVGQKSSEPAHVVRLDEQLAAFIQSHPGALEEAIEALRLSPDGTLPSPGPSIISRMGIAKPQADKYPDFLFRTTCAMLSTSPRLALWALDVLLPKSKLSHNSFKLAKSAVDLNPAYLELVLARAKDVPHVCDWLKAYCKNEPLGDVLGSDTQLAQMGGAEVTAQLASYLQLPIDQVNTHFASHGICRNASDSVGSCIVADAKTLTQHAVQRHVLADRLDALLAWANFEELARILDQKMTGEVTPTRLAARQQLERSQAECRTKVQQQLKFDPSDAVAAAAVPVILVKCSTMGHHNDVFHPHPCCSMQSYYLPGTGGSSEIAVVNKTLIAPGREAEWTVQAVTKKLSDRLNSKAPHAWEADPAVVYGSDMAPYLIRTACCFETPGVRYRIDPAKLISVLKPIL